MGAQKYDWAVLDRCVDDMLAAGMSRLAISKELGVKDGALRHRLNYRNRAKRSYDESPRVVRDPVVDRQCLSCGRPFQVRSRFLRLCPSCRSNA
ncbi:hypothetical protein [Gluconacetobacter diazotrophicus]|uniref:hypothetical protein n=1 Tax=Gluconacetobacter diazotrophicus TaxID=33996 RepID=UPI00119B4AE3|nr:hypothetical protein [Gluconacetobacter diazotrophicus]TWB00387.1 hypothetical protein FBZ86_1371 [Gluconacetobacter diazotrophicus]